MNCDVAILQPGVPHYREQFFLHLRKQVAFDLFIFKPRKVLSKQAMKVAECPMTEVKSFRLGMIFFYLPLVMLKRQYKIWVIPGYSFYPGTYCLLLLGKLLRRKVIVWGHGISNTKYIQQEKKIAFLHWLIFSLSAGAWFYCEKERALWHKRLPKLQSISLGNTIGNVNVILSRKEADDSAALRAKYHITTTENFIFCARFDSEFRRIDILLELLQSLDSKKYGLIVIGDGYLKPDFSKYSNVYDFGAVYDDALKGELFSIANIYLQPGWLGLSVVEAMAYGKPILTLRRSEKNFHGIEYGYIEEGNAGIIAEDLDGLKKAVANTTPAQWQELGNNGLEYVKKNLTIENMAAQGARLLLAMQQGKC